MGVPSTPQYYDNRPSGYNEPLHGCLIAILIGCAIIIPFLGPLVSIVVGALSTRKGGGVAVLVVGIIMILLHIAGLYLLFVLGSALINGASGPLGQFFSEAKTEMYRANGEMIQYALEDYASDNKGKYPDDLGKLVTGGYLPSMGTNPNGMFEGKFVKDVEFGSSDYAGNVTYIPVRQGKGISGYYLICYDGDEPGEDVDGDGEGDHVALVLDSGFEKGGPSLEELLE